MTRNPAKDSVAVVGLGSTGFTRQNTSRSPAGLAVDAARRAIADAGISSADIDGVCSTTPSAPYLVSVLGLQNVTHHSTLPPPAGSLVLDAVNAIHAGQCHTVLACHSVYRAPAVARSAAADPFRRFVRPYGLPIEPSRGDPETLEGAAGYAAWAGRYLHETGADRRCLGRIAVNGRRNAMGNPLAAVRDAMTLDDYLAARMVREPLCLLDLDVPVDGADAFVLTTVERARDLTATPVVVHAGTAGMTSPTEADQAAGLHAHGQHVVASVLRAKSEIWLGDVDIFLPYDGSTFLALAWTENLGWCKPGEGPIFLEESLTADGQLLIDGRIPMNPHGGGLSEGATQGSGHIREAVTQLRGAAGSRQVAGARHALVTIGGFFSNAQGFVFRAP